MAEGSDRKPTESGSTSSGPSSSESTGSTSSGPSSSGSGSSGSGSSGSTSSGSGSSGSGSSGSTSVTSSSSGWERWSILLPALTFLVGAALGAGVMGAADSGSEEAVKPEMPAAQAPSPVPTPSPSALTVTVPGACVEAAEKAERAYDVVEEGLNALRTTDARKLADLVDTLQDEEPQVRALVDQCRDAAANGIVTPDLSPEANPPAAEPAPGPPTPAS